MNVGGQQKLKIFPSDAKTLRQMNKQLMKEVVE